MTAYVSLLRGINLGPTTQVSMPELKRLYVDLGFGSVATYIRSGNVVFTSDDERDAVRDRIGTGLAEHLGMEVDIVLRTHAEMADVVARNPFPEAEAGHLSVVFLSEPVAEEVTAGLAGTDFGDDRYAGTAHEIYLHLPNGFGRSRLATRMSALRTPVAGTVRNWRTVNKLVALSNEVDAVPPSKA